MDMNEALSADAQAAEDVADLLKTIEVQFGPIAASGVYNIVVSSSATLEAVAIAAALSGIVEPSARAAARKAIEAAARRASEAERHLVAFVGAVSLKDRDILPNTPHGDERLKAFANLAMQAIHRRIRAHIQAIQEGRADKG